MKKIFGQIGRLKPECIELYRRLHEVDIYTEQWAGVRALIHDCNLQNYSIFIEDDVVFGYYEYTGSDYEADGEDGRRSAQPAVVGPYAALLHQVQCR